MPKNTPINAPIITWLSKCFARNILTVPSDFVCYLYDQAGKAKNFRIHFFSHLFWGYDREFSQKLFSTTQALF